MRALIQRVARAAVEVEGGVIAEIGSGMLLFLGLSVKDEKGQIPWLASKVANLRIFSDAAGKMNLSLKEIGGELLIVSQFTLYGNCSRGRRPDFLEAMGGEAAKALYEAFIEAMRGEGVKVASGRFGAHMAVTLVNDGPVTLLLESP